MWLNIYKSILFYIILKIVNNFMNNRGDITLIPVHKQM